MNKREQKTQPGAFLAAKEKAKIRQQFFDKMKALRNGETIWVTMKDCHGTRCRMKVEPFDKSKQWTGCGMLLIKARSKFMTVSNNEKDGYVWSNFGTVRIGEIQEYLGTVIRRHQLLDE